MKLTAGLLIGATLLILAHTLGCPYFTWLFTRIPPATPPGSHPRFRTWHHGVEVSS